MTEPRYAFTSCAQDYASMDAESKEMLHQLINAAGDQFTRQKERKSMSWSVSIVGNAEEVGKAFDAQRDACASWGMIEAEQRDIDEARDLAMHFASKYDRVSINAAGHWSIFGKDDPRNTFGQVTLSVSNAPLPVEQNATQSEPVAV